MKMIFFFGKKIPIFFNLLPDMDQQIGKVFPVRYSVGMISELDQLSFASDSDFHLLMKNKN
jgi:hypothetical protein